MRTSMRSTPVSVLALICRSPPTPFEGTLNRFQGTGRCLFSVTYTDHAPSALTSKSVTSELGISGNGSLRRRPRPSANAQQRSALAQRTLARRDGRERERYLIDDSGSLGLQ